MKKILLSLLLLAISPFNAHAQSYSFAQSTTPYTDLASPTDLFGTALWDDTSKVVPIGFPFMVGSTVFNNVEINSNGVLLFNAAGLDAGILAYFADFVSLGTSTSTSPIGYELTGTAGSRIFKVQWKNTGFYDGSGVDFANLQVWLYEGSNKIETRIGASNFVNPLDIFGSFGGPANGVAPMIDFVNKLQTGLFIEGNPGAATTLSVTNSTTYPFLNAPPVTGTVYAYSAITSGLAETLNNIRLTVYPNPVSEILQINGLSAKENVTVKIYDTLGKVVLTQENPAEKHLDVNVANLTKGTYFVEITVGKERAGKQIIKL